MKLGQIHQFADGNQIFFTRHCSIYLADIWIFFSLYVDNAWIVSYLYEYLYIIVDFHFQERLFPAIEITPQLNKPIILLRNW